VEEEGRFPYRFFVVTFAWSWLIWLPLVLAGAGKIPLGRDLLSAVTVAGMACAPAGARRNHLAGVGTAGAMGRAALEDALAFRMGLPAVPCY